MKVKKVQVFDTEGDPLGEYRIIGNHSYGSYLELVRQKDIERQEYFKKQRETMGFDDSDLWSLDITIAKFILPRLKRFKERNTCFWTTQDGSVKPDDLLDEMIYAFDIAANHQFNSKVDWEKVDNGLELFKKHFFKLWY